MGLQKYVILNGTSTPIFLAMKQSRKLPTASSRSIKDKHLNARFKHCRSQSSPWAKLRRYKFIKGINRNNQESIFDYSRQILQLTFNRVHFILIAQTHPNTCKLMIHQYLNSNLNLVLNHDLDAENRLLVKVLLRNICQYERNIIKENEMKRHISTVHIMKEIPVLPFIMEKRNNIRPHLSNHERNTIIMDEKKEKHTQPVTTYVVDNISRFQGSVTNKRSVIKNRL